nr:winged helix-turn-helix transcriptional regulator [Fodinicola feengrottensis]
MTRTPLAGVACSIARATDLFGDAWTALIMRDVLAGLTRFDDLAYDLGISRKVLAARLARLVAEQVFGPRALPGAPAARALPADREGQGSLSGPACPDELGRPLVCRPGRPASGDPPPGLRPRHDPGDRVRTLRRAAHPGQHDAASWSWRPLGPWNADARPAHDLTPKR